MIDITGINLIEFAKKVYELSVPQGLGHLHFTPMPLTNDEANQLINEKERIALDMDYVKGRACKMVVWRKNGKLTIHDSWYDHTDKTYDKLLSSFGIERSAQSEHGCACNCVDCQSARTIES